MTEQKLLASLAGVRRRLLGVSLTAGLAWGAAAVALVLIACAWVDLALDLPGGVRLACSLAAVGCGIVLIAWALVVALRDSSRGALARRLDLAANGRGQIVSGVDLFQQFPLLSGGSATAQAGGLPAAMARLAIERAAALAGEVRMRSAVPGKPVLTPLFSLGGILLALGIVGLAAPRLFATQWLRFTDPFGDHPPYSAITFDVQPGDTNVRYGGGLDVRAKSAGGTVDQLDLVLVSSNTNDKQDEVLPMFPEPGGAWRATVTDVSAAGRYFVRAHGARSRQFAYGLITVPNIKDVRFRVTPPAYTHRPPYEGPVPQNGISGLVGTKVEVWAKSNRPLSSGQITFAPSSAEGSAAAAPTTQESVFEPAKRLAVPAPVMLSPTGAGSSEVSGSFIIAQPGKFDLKVTDVAGEASTDTFSASVGLLHDDRPFVRIMEPKPNSFATPDVSLPVSILAEDDYGVTRVQVFRSLNESRPLGLDVSLPATTQPSAIPPTRLPVSLSLPLAQYGLMPGDVIKLFARVEDNDPAGAKGSESAVVTVQIISREDLNRMTLAREGMEVLQSKYEEAQRRLEALDNEIRKQQEAMKKLDPESPLAKEKEKELESLADKVGEEAKAIEQNANEDLPFDLDHKLRDELKQLAQETKDAGNEFKKSLKKPGGISSAVAARKLDELREKLGQKKDQLKEDATDPIEHLAKIFPLKEDEARFADLYNRQQDLAERMAALKSQAGGADDPKSKSRMRDLEQEQKELRDELRDILTDIDSHLAGLPDDPKLDGLRATAKKFADAVRASPAAEQMQGSESRLSEFNGSEAAQLSQRAADTLKEFISQCQGMGDEAGICLKFQPKLSAGLGNTVDQLLQAQGLSRGKGAMGSGGGYSARRSTLNNVGLYGSLPRMSRQAAKNGNGRNTPGGDDTGGGNPLDPNDPNGTRAGGRMQAAGESGANVPAVYRKKVGAYFERVSDELGE